MYPETFDPNDENTWPMWVRRLNDKGRKEYLEYRDLLRWSGESIDMDPDDYAKNKLLSKYSLKEILANPVDDAHWFEKDCPNNPWFKDPEYLSAKQEYDANIPIRDKIERRKAERTTIFRPSSEKQQHFW